MFEPYVRISDIGNGYGFSILYNAEDNIYEIAALKGGKYWPNTVIHDPIYGAPLRGDAAMIIRTMHKITTLFN